MINKSLALLCIVGVWGAGSGLAWGQADGHGVHPPMPDTKLYLKVQLPLAQPPVTKEIPLQLKTTFAAEALSQAIELPDSTLGLRAVRYLPSAAMDQAATTDETGTSPPGMELAIEGPTQSFRRWLLADDPERNRLMSYIATWRYMAVADAGQGGTLFRLFETEFTRPPTLHISDQEGRNGAELVAEVGKAATSAELNATVTVKQFFPDYAIDKSTLAPSNQSERRRNPAARVEIKQGDKVEDRWVFSKFPDFSHAGTARMPVRVTLDCAMETEGTTPDFAVVSVGRSSHEVWSRTGGRATRSSLSVDQTVGVPGSAYGFRMTAFVPSAKIVESFRAAEKGKGRPAVELTFAGEGHAEGRFWLEIGQTRRIPVPGGTVWVGLTDQVSAAPKGHP